MRKKRSFVLFATMIVVLAAMSFVSVTEAKSPPNPTVYAAQATKPAPTKPADTAPAATAPTAATAPGHAIDHSTNKDTPR